MCSDFKIILKGGLVFCVMLYLILAIYEPDYFYIMRKIWTLKDYHLQMSRSEMPCIISKLNPFDSEVMRLMKTPQKYNCSENHTMLFSTDEFSNLIVLQDNLKSKNYSECCYFTFKRGDEDWFRNFSSKCTPIDIRKTRQVAIKDEFIILGCEKNSFKELDFSLVDAFGFVHRKPKVETLLAQTKKSNGSAINVVVLGIDSLSHMNFVRKMKMSYDYLINDLKVIEMNGYFSVGENSLPNFSAFLMGLSNDEMAKLCYSETEHFDTCPLVWKKFSEKGFRTFFGEDDAHIATFNYGRYGFFKEPTDYYFQTLLYVLQRLQKINPSKDSCYGSRYTLGIMVDYLKKMATTFQKGEKYFQFVWSNTVGHDVLNIPIEADESVIEFLKWFNDRNYFERTVFFFISDHGYRIGSIQETYQGKLETKMPAFFAVFPKWFREKYPEAVSNFEKNSQRLTTPFDLHETFLDVTDCEENISPHSIQLRNDKIYNSDEPPRGISLFLSIPKSRSCAQAGIPTAYCMCRYPKPIPVNNERKAFEAANTVINTINNYFNATKCVRLALKTVKKFSILKQVVDNLPKGNATQEFQVIFVTEPGGGTFETILALSNKGEWKTGTIKDISRINLYGNQSHCVQDRTAKNFCYCKNLV